MEGAGMADIKITGRGIAVTDMLRERVMRSLNVATKVFAVSPMSADVVLRHERGKSVQEPFSCEVTLSVPKTTIRVAESAEKIEAAIDAAADRVSRQLRKHKTKVVDRHKRDRGERDKALHATASGDGSED